jgi:hypothetical protein
MLRPLVAGVLLGVVTRLAHDLPPEWQFIAKVGVPWLLVAFAVGAATHGRLRATIAGAASLVIAVLAYYALPHVLNRPYYTPLGLWWLVAAAPGGALFGWLGATWRSGRAVVAIAALVSGALVAEGLIFALWRLEDRLAGPALIGLAAAALVTLVPAGGARVRALGLTALVTVVALAAAGAVIHATGFVS